MKKIIISIISILSIFLIFIFVFKGNFSRKYHHKVTKSANLSEENVDGLYLSDEIDSEKIKAKYGEISSLSRNHDQYNYHLLKDGIEIATEKNDNKIIRFIVDDEKFKTNKGIEIGDSKDKVIEAYGENYYIRREQGLDIIGYVDKGKECSIEFWLTEKGITMIRFDYNFMI